MAEELWADDEIICTNLAEQEIASLLNCTWHLSITSYVQHGCLFSVETVNMSSGGSI